jgi:hypothetical protein
MAFSNQGITLLDGATGRELLHSRVHGRSGAIEPSGAHLATVTVAKLGPDVTQVDCQVRRNRS